MNQQGGQALTTITALISATCRVAPRLLGLGFLLAFLLPQTFFGGCIPWTLVYVYIHHNHKELQSIWPGALVQCSTKLDTSAQLFPPKENPSAPSFFGSVSILRVKWRHAWQSFSSPQRELLQIPARFRISTFLQFYNSTFPISISPGV